MRLKESKKSVLLSLLFFYHTDTIILNAVFKTVKHSLKRALFSYLNLLSFVASETQPCKKKAHRSEYPVFVGAFSRRGGGR